jgi:hypothetical protein
MRSWVEFPPPPPPPDDEERVRAAPNAGAPGLPEDNRVCLKWIDGRCCATLPVEEIVRAEIAGILQVARRRNDSVVILVAMAALPPAFGCMHNTYVIYIVIIYSH